MTEGLETFSLKSGHDLSAGSNGINAGLSAGDLNLWSSPRSQGETIAPQLRLATTSDAPGPPATNDVANWQVLKPLIDQSQNVQFSTAADNAKSGIQPDYILGADGTLRMNANKKEAPKNGELNIQVESKSGEIQAKKLAADLQKMAIKEQIAYFQQWHPGKQVPQHLQDSLSKLDQEQPVVPSDQQQKAAQPPDTSSGGDQSGGGNQGVDQGGGGSGGQNGESGLERSVGPAPSHGGRNGSFDQNGPIDRSAIPAPVAGDLAINGPPTCDVQAIQTFLEKMGSPAAKEAGFAQTLYDEGVKHNIDPAIAVGFFLQESTCGRYGRAADNYSLGNIKYSTPTGEVGYGSDGTYRRYDSWSDGAKDWFNLIDHSYVHGRGLETLSQVIHVYAPNGDASNNETAYRSEVMGVRAALSKNTANENKQTV